MDALAWYSSNSGNTTHPVGGKLANSLGLFNMSGNVWEWTCSVYEAKYAGGEQQCLSNNDATSRRAVRGGAWFHLPLYVRSAIRHRYYPADRSHNLGFRRAQD